MKTNYSPARQEILHAQLPVGLCKENVGQSLNNFYLIWGKASCTTQELLLEESLQNYGTVYLPTCFNSTASVNSLPKVKCVWNVQNTTWEKERGEKALNYTFEWIHFCFVSAQNLRFYHKVTGLVYFSLNSWYWANKKNLDFMHVN